MISGVPTCDGGVWGSGVLIGGRTGPIAVEPNLGCWWQLTEGVPRHELERRRRLSSVGAHPGAQAAVAIAPELPLLVLLTARCVRSVVSSSYLLN